MPELVSIIVPVYNLEAYLPDSIKNLTAQTYEHIEILFVDDGSRDGSGEILRQAAAGDRTGKLTEVTTGGHGGRDYRDSEQQLYSTYFSGMWNGGNLVSDGRYSYMLTPSVQTYSGNPKYSIHTYPFTITARNSSGATVWTTTVSQAVLDSSTYLRDASWGFDADGTYLYLTDSGRTALFDIRTGTYVATLPAALGPFNLLTPESIYTFKETGIWRMPRSGGSLSCIYDAPLSCPAYVGGAVQFIAKLDLGKGLGLYRGVFDPAKESVHCALLEGSLEGYARDAQGIAIDASGAAFVRSGQVFYDANTLANRLTASLYPEYREAYNANINKYGEFLPEEFFAQGCGAAVLATIKENNPARMKKLFNLLNEIYLDATNETQSLIVVTLLGQMNNDQELLANCVDYMCDDMTAPVIRVNKYLASSAGKKAVEQLKNPPPYKPKKAKKSGGLMARLTGMSDQNR